MDKFRQYKNYGIIVVLSLFCLFFLPFLQSEVGVGFKFPDTTAGWVIFVTNKLLIAGVNMMILYCFCSQGKYNVRNHPRFIEANEILIKDLSEKVNIPKSPREHSRDVFGKKGVTLFLTSVLSTVALTQAVLSFDYVTMLTYLFVLSSGVIFGIIQMGYEETWWTEDYWRYACMVRDKNLNRREICAPESNSEEPKDINN